ncbi:conjugal transfer protein TrbH [Bradyrhizobium sp. BRP14]|nr:conjugal transfer protein TrbH [Bradyrhizobium sp. BRP14]
MRKLLTLIIGAALLSGCQTADDALTTISTPVTVSGPAAGAIAGDMASRLAERISPAAMTTIKIDKDTSEYATALEAALKAWGYAVVTDGKVEKDQNPVELAWSLDSFDGQILARLTMPSIALGRAYSPAAAGATPASPLSIMRRN